jgi:hypothetical protein
MTSSATTVPDTTCEGVEIADREGVAPGRLGHALASGHQLDLEERFHRDGFALLPGVLAERAPRLRELIDQAFASEVEGVSSNRYGGFIMTRMFELHAEFQELLTCDPLISIAESLVGGSCHLVAQNVVRNRSGEAIDGFHVDDLVHLPLPPELPRHDGRWRLPCFVFTFQCLLSDVPSIDHGATQFVPGSHYSGRQPEPTQRPVWEGRGPVSILGRAGDIYLHHGQAWHRGAPNRSERTRYLLQLCYGQRFVAQRFHPFVDYRLPAAVLARADERCLRVLGRHPKGAYG